MNGKNWNGTIGKKRRGNRKRNQLRSASSGSGQGKYWVIGLVLLGLVAGGTGWFFVAGGQWDSLPKMIPIAGNASDSDAVAAVEEIELHGELRRVQPKTIEKIVRDQSQNGFLALDVNQLRQVVENLPWVYRASVRKKWPGTIVMQVEEQRAEAIWETGGFLNQQGERYAKLERAKETMTLPRIYAPDGMEQDAFRRLQQLQEIVAQLSEKIVRLRIDARGGTHIELKSGLTLSLGRRDVLKRAQRWVRHAPKIEIDAGKVLKKVDLRYGQGVALQLFSAEQQAQETENPGVEEKNRAGLL